MKKIIKTYKMFTEYGENKAPYEDLKKGGYVICRCNYYGGTLFKNAKGDMALLKCYGNKEEIKIFYGEF